MNILIKLELDENQVAAFEHVHDLVGVEQIKEWATGELMPLVYAVEAEYDDYLAEQEEEEEEEEDGYGDDAD